MGWPVESIGWDVQEAWVESVANALAWGIFGWGVVVTTVILLAMLAIETRDAASGARGLGVRSMWCTKSVDYPGSGRRPC